MEKFFMLVIRSDQIDSFCRGESLLRCKGNYIVCVERSKVSFLYRIFAYLGFGPYNLANVVLRMKKMVILIEGDIENLDSGIPFREKFATIVCKYNNRHQSSLKLRVSFFSGHHRFALGCVKERIEGWANCLMKQAQSENFSRDKDNFLEIIAMFRKFYPDKVRSLSSLIKQVKQIPS